MTNAFPTALIAIGLMMNACTLPYAPEQSAIAREPTLETNVAIMSDGYRLPLRRFGPTGPNPSIVTLALHGFNDYSRAFAPLADTLANWGIVTYAVDQRGFGATREAGRWHGTKRLTADLHTLTALLRDRYPHARLYLIGESMGGGIIMSAQAERALSADGLVLIAPAVWSRDTMPWYQRLALGGAIRVAPQLRLTGRGIRRRPSDNDAMLERMYDDPLVIKATRVEALWGITDVMDHARAAATTLTLPTLLLYGAHDQIIPQTAFCRMSGELPRNNPALRLVLYQDGWHMLPRDLQGAQVREDIATWLFDPRAGLPSGEETALDGARWQGFCRKPL